MTWAVFEIIDSKIPVFRRGAPEVLKTAPVSCPEVSAIVYRPNSLKSQNSKDLHKFSSSSYSPLLKTHFNIILQFPRVSRTLVSLQVFSLPYSSTSFSSAAYQISGLSQALYRSTAKSNPLISRTLRCWEVKAEKGARCSEHRAMRNYMRQAGAQLPLSSG